MYNSYSLTGVAGALAAALDIEAPKCSETANPQLIELVKRGTKSGHVDRLVMYNPDAIAMWLYQKYTDLFNDVVKHTQLSLPLSTVMPSVTPVCFGTMYTGAQPKVHGITKYAKPVIRIDTLFDAAIRAGKKCAIVADNECSMGKIFLERNMDYFYIDDVNALNDKAIELIEKDEYDIICVYNGNYDSAMHGYGPEAQIPMQMLKDNIAAFDRIACAIEEKWTNHDTLLGFAMDHGCHEIDGSHGSHGLDMEEDINIQHHYALIPKKA